MRTLLWMCALVLPGCGDKPSSNDTGSSDTSLTEDCEDGVDNDGDGLADCDDADCSCGDTGVTSWPALVINEFMASNMTTVTDESGAYPDWIELYNPTDTDVYLGGYTITDNLSEPDKVVLDDGLLVPAGGFLLLWADDDVADGSDHLAFKLDISGEELGLYAPDGTELDALIFDKQVTDISAARVPDGSKNWTFATTATPGTSNGDGS